MKGDNYLITTNGGGVGVLATDAAEFYGLPLQFVPKDVQEEFKKYMPEFGSAKNPVDMTGMAGNDWYYQTTKFAISHPWVDGLTVLYCETAITNPLEIAQHIHKAIVESGIKDKPVSVSMVGGEKCEKAIQWLIEHGIPAFWAPDLAVRAIAALRQFTRTREKLQYQFTPYKNIDKEKAKNIIANARADKRTALTEIESKDVFAAYGLPVTKTLLAKSENEAVELANKIGYPIVMKIVSPDILHKSDAGGVKVNIKDDQGAREAYRTILANAKKYNEDAVIHGIAIQEMADWGTEVIIGSVNDPTFEATVMFGLGGIFVEVLKDVTFRVAPISIQEAESMLTEIRGAPILKGVRGEKPRDVKSLADVLSRYSQMIEDLKDEVAEKMRIQS
jgi:acetyltransferase